MGKAKNNKFKRQRFSGDGLPAKEVLENEDEVEDSPGADFLEKVQHLSYCCFPHLNPLLTAVFILLLVLTDPPSVSQLATLLVYLNGHACSHQ